MSSLPTAILTSLTSPHENVKWRMLSGVIPLTAALALTYQILYHGLAFYTAKTLLAGVAVS